MEANKNLEIYIEQVSFTIRSIEELLDKVREKLEVSSLTDEEFEEVETLLLRAISKLYEL